VGQLAGKLWAWPMLLTREEIAHFKREGFVIRYGLLDPGLMAKCRDRLWQGAPVRMDRDDPTTYFGPLRKDEEIGSGSHGIMHNSKAGFIWKERAAGGARAAMGCTHYGSSMAPKPNRHIS